VNTKPSFKFSSHLLISTLIATSFLMVNCNKGGGRTGVKAKTVAGKVDPSQKGTVSNTKLCSADILRAYVPLTKEYARVKKLHDTKEAEKTNEKLKSEYEKVLAACDVLGVAFDKEKLTDCALASKDNLPKVPTQCTNVAVYLFKEDGTKSPYLKQANDQVAITQKQQEQKLMEDFKDFKNEKLLISEEMKVMLKHENLNFKMYILDGEIKTNQDELKKSYQDKKVICSFSGTSTPVVEKEKVFISLLDVVENEKSEAPEVMSFTAGLAMSASTKEDQSPDDVLKMVCSHISKDKPDVKLLKKAFGKHLAVEAKESQAKQAEPVVATKASGDGTQAKVEVQPVAKSSSADDSKADNKDDKKIELKKSKASTAQSGDGSIEVSTLSLAP